MTTQAILRTLELLYATHELPVACFQENLSLLHAYCSYPGYAPIFSAIAGKAPNDKTISLVSGYAGLYGTVHIRENKLLLVTGPFLNKKPDEALLDRLLHDYASTGFSILSPFSIISLTGRMFPSRNTSKTPFRACKTRLAKSIPKRS